MHLKTSILISCMLGVMLTAVSATSSAEETGFWQTPVIHSAGKMHPLPKAAYQPAKDAQYKIVFMMTKGPKTPSEVNPAIERVARTVNLYASAGVPLDHLHFVAIAAGAATPVALNNTAYHDKFGVDNPNLVVVKELRAHGVDVAVCGQAMAEHHFSYDLIDSSVTLALSSLTTVTSLEAQGYVLMPL